jgi:hypothetical protein
VLRPAGRALCAYPSDPGHVSPEITARVYTHLDVEDLRVAVEEANPTIGGRANGLVRAS